MSATTSAPVAERNARRFRACASVTIMVIASSSRLLGGALDGAQRRIVSAAAADQVGQGVSDLFVGGMRIAIQQFGRGHDPAADAIAALVDLLLDPSGLD